MPDSSSNSNLAVPCPYCGHHTLYSPSPDSHLILCANPLCDSNFPPPLIERVIATCDCWPESALRSAPGPAVNPLNHDPGCPSRRVIQDTPDTIDP